MSMADSTDPTPWISARACIHFEDTPPEVEANDLSGRTWTGVNGSTFGHGDDAVTVTLCRHGSSQAVEAYGTLDQHQAFVSAYQAQIDKVRAARALAAEQADPKADEPERTDS
jgi:hypothetical protein